MKNNNSIKNVPATERPYEKFIKLGASALSDAELLSILLKTGTTRKNSIHLAREVLSEGQKSLLNLYDYSIEKLMQIEGIGQVKAIQLKTIAELSLRIARTQHNIGPRMTSISGIADYYMETMRHTRNEYVIAAFFDSKLQLIGDETIAIGSLNCAYLEPRSVIGPAIACNASTIVILHNHPSGDSSPSKADYQITERLNDAIKLMGLALGDHIIIGDKQYYIFIEIHFIT